jgi:hypothetical protein
MKTLLADLLEIAGLLILAIVLFCVTLPVLTIARSAQWLVYDGPLKLSEYVHWRWLMQRRRRY